MQNWHFLNLIIYLLLPACHVFSCFHVTNQHSFMSSWRISFNTSFKPYPMLINSLKFCLSEKSLFILHFWNTFVAKVFLLFFFFSTLNIWFYTLSWHVRFLLRNLLIGFDCGSFVVYLFIFSLLILVFSFNLWVLIILMWGVLEKELVWIEIMGQSISFMNLDI